MINIKELDGTRLKKDVGLQRVVKRWHNHNTRGGNFGINLITGLGTDYELTGYHDLQGNIYNLTFAELYRAVGPDIITRKRPETLLMTYPELVKKLRETFFALRQVHQQQAVAQMNANENTREEEQQKKNDWEAE